MRGIKVFKYMKEFQIAKVVFPNTWTRFEVLGVEKKKAKYVYTSHPHLGILINIMFCCLYYFIIIEEKNTEKNNM